MIKKIIPIIKDKKFFILGLLLTVSLLWPLVVAPYFTHHDDVQTIRLFEMDKCFQDGQIPCRWVPDLGDLYGYPLFNYYAPLPYYVGEIFYLITHNLIFSAKTMFAISFIGSYIFMFLLGKKLWGSAGGMVSGVFYSFAPYHAVDFYVRGAMGELWALMFFPAIFWATLRLKDSPKIANILLLSVSIAGLILSHNLSAMIFLPTVVLFSFVLFFFKKDLRFLATFVIAVVGGLLLPAFYLLPVIFEKNLVHVDTTTMGYFSYTEHFKGLRKLILDRFWGWGDSVREVPGGPKDGMSFQIGWAHLLALGFAVFAAFSFWKRQKLKSLTILFAVLVILGSIFMIHPPIFVSWRLEND
ncbi:MAG: 6-pyruvoyl-tetrahydropterin synthase-related protein [Patescibacteria group bacterium]|nr:6-pyruvoyl-tetrahydropterin synthase-related protein [Patescibacteria group bacterium]